MIASVAISLFRDSQVPVITRPLNHRHILSGDEDLDTLDREYLAKLSVSDILREGSIKRSGPLLPGCQEISFICRFGLVLSGAELSPLAVRDARNRIISLGQQWLRKWAKRATNRSIQVEVIMSQLHIRLRGLEQEPAQLNLSLIARYALHGLKHYSRHRRWRWSSM
jgi:hypothetical protein